jgi:hypothetical protein
MHHHYLYDFKLLGSVNQKAAAIRKFNRAALLLKKNKLCFGVTGKTPGLISHNNSVKDIFVCASYHNNVLERCDSIFPLLRCQGVWNRTSTQPSLSQILFSNLKNYSLGDVQRFCYHSRCNLAVTFD